MCCISYKLLVAALKTLTKYLSFAGILSTMSSKNNLKPHPWHPGWGLTPGQWHHMESNRIAAYLYKQRRSTFPFSGYQHEPPPTAFDNIFNPPVDLIQQLPSNLINPAPYGLSQIPAWSIESVFSARTI